MKQEKSFSWYHLITMFFSYFLTTICHIYQEKNNVEFSQTKKKLNHFTGYQKNFYYRKLTKWKTQLPGCNQNLKD